MELDWSSVAPAFARSLAWVIIAAGLIQNIVQLLQLALSARALSARPQAGGSSTVWRQYSGSAPAIALLAPAFNEERSIADSIRSLLALRYPNFEVIVINDGSTDGTLDVLIDAFSLRPTERSFDQIIPGQEIRGLYAAEHQPRLLVVDKVNGGKADALNAGLNLARAPIVCAMDADSLLEPDALLRAVQPFVDDPEKVVAVGGSIRVVNGCEIASGRVMNIATPTNPWALFQTIEYLRAFLMGRLAWSQLGALTVISGAFGLFNRDLVLDVGGYSLGTVGEDMELVMKLHRRCRDLNRPYRIVFEADPVCWTEAPETLSSLARQRARWQRGALETFSRHEDMLFNPRFGRIGMLGLPYMLLVDVIGPIAEVLGYLLIPVLWMLHLLSIDFLEAFLALSVGFGVAMSVGGLALEESRFRKFPAVRSMVALLIAAIVENFGYRQLTNVWRMWGTYQYARGATEWGVMVRRGFKPA